ncbi:thioredoxin family protein [Bremerella cremea]|uniref:Thioredoxin family protein n=1 Tax=Bremerella cremea TaxID=1031537 RepID=A0A368KQC6_9BACT|nr:thioredoxin family protein [Bremerella cremea]RCS43963.1 thioredoxin family protein [Bremerella cremea]
MMKIVLALLLPAFLASSLGAAEAETIALSQAAVSLAYVIATHARPQVTPLVPPQPETASSAQLASYHAAYEAYTKQGRPMVVMVTATWCPYCPQVKGELAAMQRDQQLGNASLVILDYDQQSTLAQSVMGKHRSLPFVALFTHEAKRPRTYRQVSTKQLKQYLQPKTIGQAN